MTEIEDWKVRKVKLENNYLNLSIQNGSVRKEVFIGNERRKKLEWKEQNKRTRMKGLEWKDQNERTRMEGLEWKD